MSLAIVEDLIRWIGGLFALLTLAVIFIGIWQGARRTIGTTTGRSPGLLHSPLFYLAASSVFFGGCLLLWRPLPITVSAPARAAVLILGTLLYFPGMAFTLWGRLALGKMYFVSTGMGAQLFANHQLVTHGPFANVRHPMYVGLSIAAVGGLFLFQTWTMIFFLLLPFGFVRRARIEEQVLAAEFGEEWLDYCQRVPPLIPRIGRFFP
ncbi:MAG TPA: isoprenylcysteine carboxylmethyltransferase family protein [Anaerolineales bacterium]|nr:isoprenylcysteine carboxylmethyltransferase family protein [Anaerolineales bacterium]